MPRALSATLVIRVFENVRQIIATKQRMPTLSRAKDPLRLRPGRPHVRKRKHDGSAAVTPRRATINGSRLELGREQAESPHEPSYLGRADYLDTHAPIDEDHVSRYQRSPAQSTTVAVAASTSSLESLLTQSARDSLVSSFMRRCRPWMPLLNSDQVYAMFEANREPTFLMLAILVAGSKVSTSPQAQELGWKCYDAAKLRFYSGHATDTLDTITGTVILQWWNQTGPEHISIDNSSMWLRMGVALAHQAGLHRQNDPRNPQFARRRKLWWALVSRDNQIATSHGRPRAIHPKDSDVRPLDSRDFEDGDQDADLFINFVSITSILGDLTQACLRGELSHRRRSEIQDRLLAWLRDLPAAFHLHDRSTRRLSPYTFTSRQLHVPYFVSLIILFRQRTPGNCPPAISLLASSFISGIFEEYLDWGDIAFVSPPSIFYLLVASLVQTSSHRFPPLTIHRDRERRITHQALQELKKRFHTAVGAERIVQSMDRVSSQVSATPSHLDLEDEQRDLLAPFGRDLCIQWEHVMNTATVQSNHRVAQPIHNPSTPMRANDRLTGLTAQNVAEFQVPCELGMQNNIAGNDALLPQICQEQQTDLFGQWWWSDFLPDL